MAPHRSQGRQRRTATVGARGDDAYAARRHWRHARCSEAWRHNQSTLSPAAGQEQRLSARVSEDLGRNGQRLGRRQGSSTQGFLAMRVIGFLLVSRLSIANVATAQDWDEYTSLQDGFRINFPGTPKISTTTWTSQLNYTLPARVYSAERGKERYSVTVVDYSSIEQQGIERAKSCPPGNANCRANAPATLGPGYSHHDERGAIVYATFKLLQRDAKLNYLTW